jgi:hypothetical protein
MTLLDNSILHVLSQLVFLFALGCFIVSQIKKNPRYSQWGLFATSAGLVQIITIAVLKEDPFVLSSEVDYGANYLFSFSAACLVILTIVGLSYIYYYNLVPLIYMQATMMFTGILIVVTFSTSVYHSLREPEIGDSRKIKFIKAEDFEKGSKESGFSKASSKSDSLTIR